MIISREAEETVLSWLDNEDDIKSKVELESAVLKVERAYDSFSSELKEIPDLQRELKEFISENSHEKFVRVELVSRMLNKVNEFLAITGTFLKENGLILFALKEGIFERKIRIDAEEKIRTVYADEITRRMLFNLLSKLEDVDEDKVKDIKKVLKRILETEYKPPEKVVVQKKVVEEEIPKNLNFETPLSEIPIAELKWAKDKIMEFLIKKHHPNVIKRYLKNFRTQYGAITYRNLFEDITKEFEKGVSNDEGKLEGKS